MLLNVVTKTLLRPPRVFNLTIGRSKFLGEGAFSYFYKPVNVRFLSRGGVFGKEGSVVATQLNGNTVSLEKKPNHQSYYQSSDFFSRETVVFKDLVIKPTFVDHTELIKLFLLGGQKQKFIAAPSRFCKTANLHMIKAFFQIEVDENGIPLLISLHEEKPEWKNMQGKKLQDMENYKLFNDNKCEIMKDTEFVENHLGRYPVVHLDFKISGIRSIEEAETHIASVIRMAWREHKYLERNKEAQEYCKKWCSINLYKNLNPKEGLAFLCESLHSYFGRKVIVLVDEYDSVITEALIGLREAHQHELSDIVQMMSGILLQVVRPPAGADPVERVLITGISLISGIGLSGPLSTVERCKFTEQEALVPYYGITKEDLEKLVNKLKNGGHLPKFENQTVKEIMTSMRGLFNGYYCQDNSDVEIYSLWSVLHYLENGRPSTKVGMSNMVTSLSKLFSFPNVMAALKTVMENEPLTIKFRESVHLHSLQQFHRMIQDPKTGYQPNTGILFTYLTELGYLSVPKRGGAFGDQPAAVQLPNDEIRAELAILLQDALQIVKGFDPDAVEECGLAVGRLCTAAANNFEEFRVCLLHFFKKFKVACNGLKSWEPSDLKEMTLQILLFLIFSRSDFRMLVPEQYLRNEWKEKGFVDILLIHHPSNCLVLCEQKHNKQAKLSGSKEYPDESSIRAMLQIVGKRSKLYERFQETKSLSYDDDKNKFPGYVSAVDKYSPSHFILMGATIDSNCKPSISCVLDKKNPDMGDIMIVSEDEFRDFPKLYDGCQDLMKIASQI